MMPRVLLCVATKKGREVLSEAIGCGFAESLCVCTCGEPLTAEPFDEEIRGLAVTRGIPLAPWRAFRENPPEFLHARGIGAVICIGWRYLVPQSAIDHLRGEVLIAHDALLPKFRGFAPLPTALIVGEKRTGVTFLRPGRGIDDGGILWQGVVDIGPLDTISTLIDKVCPLYREGARHYLRGNLVKVTPQDETAATYSLWRDELDYELDWSLDADRLERSVRALGPPYLGARTTLAGNVIVLRSARVVDDVRFEIRQPGKIWCLDEKGRPTVVCGRGMLKITSAVTLDGGDVLPLKSLRQRFR